MTQSQQIIRWGSELFIAWYSCRKMPSHSEYVVINYDKNMQMTDALEFRERKNNGIATILIEWSACQIVHIPSTHKKQSKCLGNNNRISRMNNGIPFGNLIWTQQPYVRCGWCTPKPHVPRSSFCLFGLNIDV